ncbi:MAG: DMT family transporter [Pseudomonadota bacterium]
MLRGDVEQSSPGRLRGIGLMIATMALFATQDGISRHLAADHHPIFIVMIRYWAFAAFVVTLSANRPGGLRVVARTAHPLAQTARGLLLAAQICVVTYSFDRLGLAETHAIMSVYPLLVAAGGAIFLGERIAVVQWAAIAFGFVGVLIIVRPGSGVFEPFALVPLLCAVGFATYGILTRWVGKRDTAATSFFFTGIAGAAGISLIGPFFWSELTGSAWLFLAALCVIGASGHFLLIKAYETAEVAALQPFAYVQLMLASAIGVIVFNESLSATLIVGSIIVVGAGLLALRAGTGAACRSVRR